MSFFPIAEYCPDIAEINSNFTDEIRNVLVADGSYIPMPEFVPLSQALPQKPLGAFALRSLDGTIFIFVGTANKIFLFNHTDLSWNDVTPEGQAYSATDSAPWSFVAFGNQVIAVNQNDKPQLFKIGVASQFRDLGGFPPRAGVVKVWGDFVCLMKLSDNPGRVHWSGLNDAECWSVGENNCDYQDFPDGGVVQGSSEATNPIIFLQTAIYAATFIPGSDVIFSFQKIKDKHGAKSARSIACRGADAFYIGEGGFFQIDADGLIIPIGFEKLDRTFFSRLETLDAAEVLGVIDPFYSRVYWAIDYTGAGVFDEMLVYDWKLQRWSSITINASLILPIYTSGYSLDGLDQISTRLDALPFSLDSKVWDGGSPVLGALSADFQLGLFLGKPMQATVLSQELGATDGSVYRLESVMPVVDSDNISLSIGARLRRTSHDPLHWSPACVPSYNTQRVHKRVRARYHRFKLCIPAGETWHHMKGFDATFHFAGLR